MQPKVQTANTAFALPRLVKSLSVFLQDIKLAHSLFALPFAGVGLLLAEVPLPTLAQGLLLLACMVTARSFAMGVNRFADRNLDAANPRTAGRMLPSGRLQAAHACFWIALMAAGFVVSAQSLNPQAGWLALPLLAVLSLYSFFKRFSWLSHWYLGFCLGLAPIAVSVALQAPFSWAVLLVGLAVLFWTAGFDLLYALQDRSFDLKAGLHSFPARFGVKVTVWASRCCFAVMVAALLAAGLESEAGPFFFAGVAVVVVFLAFEHWLIRAVLQVGESRHIPAAFFLVNAWVSVVFFLCVVADELF